MAVRTSSGQDAIVWDEWEFFNPLMNQGVEYKTIEKYESASLYKKIDGGILKWRPEGESNWKAVAEYIGAVRYDADQELSASSKQQVRKNMSAQGGSYLHTALSKIGWYRIITTTSDAAGLFTIYHHYGSGGPSSLKLLVTFDYHSPALKCIEYTGGKYNSQITNVRMIKTSDDKYCLDVFYNINYAHNVAIDFINTGRYEVILQEPIYLSETDDLSEGETLLTPMEYLNPPMTLGVEYRTTERYLGKPVYCQVIDCGVITTDTQKIVDKSIPVLDVLSCEGIIHTNSNGHNQATPFDYSDTNGTKYSVTVSAEAYKQSEVDRLSIYVNSSWTVTGSVYAIVRYTKETDQ